MLLKNYQVKTIKAFKNTRDRIKVKRIYMTWFALVNLSFILYDNFYAVTSLLVHPQYFLIFIMQLKNSVKLVSLINCS